MELRDEVLSSVGAQDIDTSGYQVSADMDDVEFYWENDQLDVDADFRPGIDAPFPPSSFNDFEMGSMAENSILIDKEQEKENSPPLPATPFSRTQPQPHVLMRSRPFGTRIENVPDKIYGNLIEYLIFLLLCMFFW